MSQDPDTFAQDEPLSIEREPSVPGRGGRLQDNLLLLSGLGLVLVATGMVLGNVL